MSEPRLCEFMKHRRVGGRPAAARMRCPVCGFTVARHVIDRHIGDEYECPRCTDAVASEFVQDKHDD